MLFLSLSLVPLAGLSGLDAVLIIFRSQVICAVLKVGHTIYSFHSLFMR